MKKHFLLLVLFVVFTVKAQKSAQASPIFQLRIYEIFESNKKEFHERFRDHAMRIMKKYNF